MLETLEIPFLKAGEADDWTDRCRYWAAKAEAKPNRKRRERRREPLALTGHNLSLRVDKGRLIVRGGHTHFPSQVTEHALFKGSLDLPPRIVAVDGSGNVTLDALDWMAEQGIAFVRINYDGTQTVAASPTGYAADPDKVKWQRETRDTPERQLAFGVETIRNKLKAALETLNSEFPESPAREKAITATLIGLEALDSGKANTLSLLLATEGKAAFAYWSAWRTLTPNWKATSRYPIPDEWKAFNARSSVLTGAKHKNVRASNPINAMLNYAYAVLMTDMRVKAIADGYDPMIGILHDQRHYAKDRTPSFALDLMEPLRPVVDRAVLGLIRKETFTGADFQLQSDGVCRLTPELARVVAMGAMRAIQYPSIDECRLAEKKQTRNEVRDDA